MIKKDIEFAQNNSNQFYMTTLDISPYIHFSRQEWAALRNAVPMTLTENEVTSLQGINEKLDINEIKEIYLPLSRLIDYYFSANIRRQIVLSKFLGKYHRVPYVIGIAGSVAVGKSTTARILQALLSRWPEHRKVALVTTDGFLYPNRILKERNIMNRKGFPESYDAEKLLQFISDIKSGKKTAQAPIYSQLAYDIVNDSTITVEQPDILILEGINVLQGVSDKIKNTYNNFISDYIDFSIYVDADTNLLHQWYIDRFLQFRAGAFSNPKSYFHHYSTLSESEAIATADRVWTTVNQINLEEHILPTRERAHLILTKGNAHKIEQVHLRK